MKKVKIVSILLIAAMIIGMFAGCSSKISLEDVQKDPSAFIEAGIKKSLAASPFGEIVELKNTKATSASLEIVPIEEDMGYLNLDVVFAHDDLAALVTLDADFEGEKVDGKLYADATQLAIMSNYLQELFGSKSVGITLQDLGNKFAESAWYKALIVESGIEDEMNAIANEESLDLQKVVDAYSTFIDDLEAIATNCAQYEIKETKIELDSDNVNCFEIKETIAEATDKEMEKAYDKFVQTILGLCSADMQEELKSSMEESYDEFKEIIKEILESTTTTYYLAQKGGALLKVETNMNIEINGETYVDADYSFDFGGDPEKLFAPDFKFVVESDGVEQIVTGTSTVDVAKKTYNLTINYKSDNECSDDAEIDITLDKDGNYKTSISVEDEEFEFDGQFQISGSKMYITVNMKEIEDSELNQIILEVDFDADVPKPFEYDNLLLWDDEKVKEFIETIDNVGY